MASDPLPPSHTSLTDGTVLFDEALMTIGAGGEHITGTVIGHVDRAAAQAALDANKVPVTVAAVRHTWVQINRHAADCDVDQQRLLDTFAEFLEPEPARTADRQLSDLPDFLDAARDSVCSCRSQAQAGYGADWWLRPATARDLHAIPATAIVEANDTALVSA